MSYFPSHWNNCNSWTKTTDLSVIWEAMSFIWRHRNASLVIPVDPLSIYSLPRDAFVLEIGSRPELWTSNWHDGHHTITSVPNDDENIGHCITWITQCMLSPQLENGATFCGEYRRRQVVATFHKGGRSDRLSVSCLQSIGNTGERHLNEHGQNFPARKSGPVQRSPTTLCAHSDCWKSIFI